MLKKIVGLTGSGFLFTFGAVLALVLGIVLVVAIGKLADDPVEMAIPHSKTDNGVFILPLEGEIVSSEKFRRVLAKAVEKKQIKSIVVAIDSPGGAVGPSEEINRAIAAADKKKPVMCALGSVAASGGLYSAVACRRIFTNQGTLTGSIGVIMSYPTVSKVMSQAGVQMNVIKSGELKDVGSPFRESTDRDRDFLRGLVQRSYEQFLGAVAAGRKLDIAKVRPFADGRIILGEEAVALGLADEIGGVEEAAKSSFEAAGGTGELEILYAKKTGGFTEVFQESRLGRFVRTFLKAEILYRSDLM